MNAGMLDLGAQTWGLGGTGNEKRFSDCIHDSLPRWAHCTAKHAPWCDPDLPLLPTDFFLLSFMPPTAFDVSL